MQVEKLRTLIRESIQEYIKEIDEAAETAAMEARIAKCDEAIATRENKLSAISESDHKDLMDEGKIKGLENEIKELKKAKAKFEKLQEKRANKLAGKKDKKEVVADAKTKDAPVDEADVMAEMDVTDEAVEETAINESFLKMQKLAGVITESQYNKKKSLIENELGEASFIDKAKSAIGAELKEPKEFNSGKISGKTLNSDQKYVKNKIIMALNDFNKNIKDNFFKETINVDGLVDNGLIINTTEGDRTKGQTKKFEEELKRKGLKVSSTSKSSTSQIDYGEYRSDTRDVTQITTTMTVTK